MAEHEPCIGETSTPEVFAALHLKFDLDQCSPGRGVCHVPAKRIYTKEDDGLVQPCSALCFAIPLSVVATATSLGSANFGNGIAIVRAYTSSS
jgi:hypothetical protein